MDTLPSDPSFDIAEAGRTLYQKAQEWFERGAKLFDVAEPEVEAPQQVVKAKVQQAVPGVLPKDYQPSPEVGPMVDTHVLTIGRLLDRMDLRLAQPGYKQTNLNVLNFRYTSEIQGAILDADPALEAIVWSVLQKHFHFIPENTLSLDSKLSDLEGLKRMHTNAMSLAQPLKTNDHFFSAVLTAVADVLKNEIEQLT
jgi:hypothetical protein